MTQKIFLGKLLDIAELTSVVVDSDNDQKNFEEAARGQREGGDEVKPSLQQEGGAGGSRGGTPQPLSSDKTWLVGEGAGGRGLIERENIKIDTYCISSDAGAARRLFCFLFLVSCCVSPAWP